jgi:hypothetical protein
VREEADDGQIGLGSTEVGGWIGVGGIVVTCVGSGIIEVVTGG